MFNIYQHWDPLEVCIVGRSYGPEFYNFVKNPRTREIINKIAEETEEDYQALIKLLEKFDVKVLRPNTGLTWDFYINPYDQKLVAPPMTPRDYSLMLGSKFFWQVFKQDGAQWPPAGMYPNQIQEHMWGDVLAHIKDNVAEFYAGPGDVPEELGFNGAIVTRVGQDLFFGTNRYGQNMTHAQDWLRKNLPEYRCHTVDTGGHSDGVFCVAAPGLIISTQDISNYEKTFPGWEVLYLPYSNVGKLDSFMKLKDKSRGRWWVPGEEDNQEFTDFVHGWLDHWLGYVEETVFDVNMLVIDPKNIVTTSYNEVLFKKLEQYGITAHVVPFRHRHFWDGGLHCITSDVSRRGTMQSYL
jgi:N-dimethylarginine dimethylaminohydrolase